MISPDEDTSFSTKAELKEDRILARRQRIRAREEEALQAAKGTTKLTDKDVTALQERSRKSKQQVVVSKQRLYKLKTDGIELAGNVRVAFNARESQRRTEEWDAQRSRGEKIESERTAARERFDEISKKWEAALSKKLPQDLLELLNQQRQQCDALYEEKDKLIQDFQQELRLKDDRYVKDLKKQGDDVDMILERMEKTVTSLTRNYMEELEQIEAAFESERAGLMHEQRKEWEEVLDKRRHVELENLRSQQAQIAEHQHLLHDIRISDAEEMCQLKNKLENEIQVLQQQMQATKASYQLNTEKLEYNYHVLKKRDEENSSMRNAQKRKLGMLNDQYMNLKKKLALAEKQTAAATRSLSNDYRRITEQFRDLEKKAKHFSKLDKSRYREIWKMNEEIAKGKVMRLVEIDRLFHEQQLGLEYKPPSGVESPVLLSDGRVVEAGLRSAHDLAKTIITPGASQVSVNAGTTVGNGKAAGGFATASTSGSSHSTVDSSKYDSLDPTVRDVTRSDTAAPAAGKLPDHVIRKVLELLVTEADYLIEPRLGALVTSLDPDEQLLMKVDSLFKVLLIESEDDVRRLAKHFVDAVAPLPMSSVFQHAMGAPQLSPSTSPGRTEEPYDIQSAELGEGMRKLSLEPPSSFGETVSPSVAESYQYQADNQEFQVCQAELVQERLRLFVEERSAESQKSGSFWTVSMLKAKPQHTPRVDEEYWQKLAKQIPDTRIQMWKGLHVGLTKYHDLLRNRDKKREQLERVLSENAEVETMLQDYMESTVNRHLQIPPSYTLTS